MDERAEQDNMPDCLIEQAGERPALPLHSVAAADVDGWLEKQPASVKAWLDSTGFKAKPGRSATFPGPDGALSGALIIPNEQPSLWDYASLQGSLPPGDWALAGAVSDATRQQAALAWALAAYRFDRYKQSEREVRRLLVGAEAHEARILAEAVYLARDLINTPANDMGPADLEGAARTVADAHGAAVRTIEGDALLEESFPAVHAVGRASDRMPRVIDLVWGDARAPKLTLVGKGVCFDTGGLDIKPSASMLLMKKDMGGAATMLAVAKAVMALNLPVRLRLLIGAVENSIAGNAFRPGDILKTRKGLSVEIGNTDAEGRLVLADLLALADEEKPDLMIDGATLTGAARVALGAELPAMFTPDDRLAADLLDAGTAVEDPLWRLPLFKPYREIMDSPVADINNAGAGGMAGAITAALFLKDFVTETSAWAHLDIYCWNQNGRPGRPKGGEATALRALVRLIQNRFALP
jgi:leucyl aminopeptidase